ncbi:hypothetical protein V2J09_008205 [Rumex salicifolius]
MTASTMSITASPAASTRRRPVVSGDTKKGNVERVNEGVNSLIEYNAVSSATGDDDKIAGGCSRDLSHSISGEKVLEGSKDMVYIKKPVQPNSTISPPGLVQMIRKLMINFSSDGSVNLMAFSDMEGRIADVQSYIKKTTTMLQVQLEAVDRKMEVEVLGLRGEMKKKFEENNAVLASRFRTFDKKTDYIEKALKQLTSKDLLSKEDFARFYEESSKSKIGNSGKDDLNLDEIRALARGIVEKEIEKHAADGLARSVAYDRSSAPRDCRVYGWLQEAQDRNAGSSVDSHKILLTEFSYVLDKSNAQTYNVFDSVSSAVVDTISHAFLFYMMMALVNEEVNEIRLST